MKKVKRSTNAKDGLKMQLSPNVVDLTVRINSPGADFVVEASSAKATLACPQMPVSQIVVYFKELLLSESSAPSLTTIRFENLGLVCVDISSILRVVLDSGSRIKQVFFQSFFFGDDASFNNTCEAISDFAGLEHLSFNCCGLNAAAIESLSSTALPKLPSLLKLDLPFNSIRGPGFASLVSALPLLPVLEELRVNSNMIDVAGVSCVANALRRSTALRVIDISNNFLDHSGLRILFEELPHLSNLQDLRLVAVANGGEAWECFGESVLSQAGSSLLYLDISMNAIGDKALSHICKHASALSGLEFLGLSSNNISDVGIESLAIALPEIRSLTSLQLSRNVVTNGLIFSAASKLPVLKSLNLSWNNISLDNVHGLETMGSLEELDLSSGDLRTSIEPLLSGLRTLSNLKSLNVAYSGLSTKEFGVIIEALLPRLAHFSFINVRVL